MIRHRLSRGGIPLSIALMTLVVFSPALWNGFVEWDDRANLLDNPDYRGLGWKQLRWMFTSVLMGHWIPLTWATLGLDYLAWGMNPLGYHLTSLLIHAANAGLFYFVALRLISLATTRLGETTRRLGAATAALFFALHPLRAESVAWVTERRDVLSGLFFLLTVLTYLKACGADGKGRGRWLAVSVGSYALALASKSIVMTLPLVLIVLDIYPLRRLGGQWRDWTAPAARRAWKEKVPYFLLALAGGGMALYALRANSYLTPLEKLPLVDRPPVVLYSLWFYLWKTLTPLGLSPLYELPERVNPLEPRFAVAALMVGALTAAFWLLRRRWPAGLAVWIAYLLMLGPVNGLLHNGHQLAHDRYSYLAGLGSALLVGAGIGAVIQAGTTGTLRPWVARLAAGAGTVWLLGLAVLTWHQVQVWRDTDTLWRYAVDSEPNCAICHANLGVSLTNQGLPALAIEHFQRALALRPDRVRTHGTLGLALLNAGRPSEAIEHFHKVLARYPADPDVLNNLGVALIQQGKPGEALAPLRQAIGTNPDRVQIHTNLGVALTDLGNSAEAVGHFRRAVELEPKAALPRFGLARAYLALGDTGSARQEYETLERLDSRLASQLPQLAKR